MINVAFSPSRMEANNTTIAQQFITETLRGAQLPSIMLMTNGEIAKKVSAHGYD